MCIYIYIYIRFFNWLAGFLPSTSRGSCVSKISFMFTRRFEEAFLSAILDVCGFFKMGENPPHTLPKFNIAPEKLPSQ